MLRSSMNTLRAAQPITAPGTISEVVTLYLQHTKKDQAASTYEGRERVLNEFASDNPITLALAKPFHLRLWVDAQTRWKSDWSRKQAISYVQTCFNWAVRLGMIDRNPFAGVTNPEGKTGRAMTDAEFARRSGRPRWRFAGFWFSCALPDRAGGTYGYFPRALRP